MLEIIGFVASIIGLGLAFYPPTSVSAKAIHAAYGVCLLVTAGIFAYLLWGSNAELRLMKAQAEEKAKISTQAKALVDTFSYVSADTCSGIRLSGFSFLEEWKSAIPDTYETAKVAAKRATEGLKEELSDQFVQRDECRRDAEGMRQLVKGLSTQ